MKYLLDTNACIRYLNGRAPQIRVHLAAVALSDVAVSTITAAELFYGSAKSQTLEISRRRQLEFLVTVQSLPFDTSCALRYGTLRADLQGQGTPIGHLDMLIAAVALTHDLILITHNMREFRRIPSLRIEDWEI